MSLTFVPADAGGSPAWKPHPTISEEEAREIGIEAYLYFYPLVMMEVTRRVMTNVEDGVRPGLGPMNVFHHMRTFPDANYRDVVRPNFDTLYSSAWVDVSNEPVLITVPDTDGRYYLLPMLDMWTDVFAVPGKRTTGTRATRFAVTTRDWRGELPPGVQRIDAPTPVFWIKARTQTNGVRDFPSVNSLQNALSMKPLSSFGREPSPPPVKPDPRVNMTKPPLNQVNDLTAGDFFGLAAELLKIYRPHPTDWSLLARLPHIGFMPRHSFVLRYTEPPVRAALEHVPELALALMQSAVLSLSEVRNGWQMNTHAMGVYGNDYLKRAVIALIGLGWNQPQDAIYPLNVSDADGDPVVGGRAYSMHFEKDAMPPARAFWSITMYDEEGFQVFNVIERFAIGDRDNLKYNADGSLDIFIQTTRPESERESNWLPSPPTGKLSITMRLYAPRPEAIDGRWTPPPITKAEAEDL